MKTLKILSFALLFSGFLISCGGEQKPAADETNIEKTMDEAGEKAGEAMDKAGEAAQDAANTVEAAVDSAASAVEGAMEGEGGEATEEGHEGHDH